MCNFVTLFDLWRTIAHSNFKPENDIFYEKTLVHFGTMRTREKATKVQNPQYNSRALIAKCALINGQDNSW